MSRLALALVPLLVVVLASVPTGAAPGPCGGSALAPWLQDDAGTGRDIGDGPLDAWVLPRDATLSGRLELPSPTTAGDQADRYAIAVDQQAGRFMVELASYALASGLEPLVADVYAPGATAPTASLAMDGGQAVFDAMPGEWSVRVRFAVLVDGCVSAPSGGLPGPLDLSTLLQGYTVYIGCDPFCVSA